MKVSTLPATVADGVFPAGCPSRTVLDHITSKWGVLILLSLSEGDQRWSTVARSANVSQHDAGTRSVHADLASKSRQRTRRGRLILRALSPPWLDPDSWTHSDCRRWDGDLDPRLQS